jgi:hypothetical protein
VLSRDCAARCGHGLFETKGESGGDLTSAKQITERYALYSAVVQISSHQGLCSVVTGLCTERDGWGLLNTKREWGRFNLCKTDN